MRHLEIRDLWLQKEVREGRLIVEKIEGAKNAANLMTKVLNLNEIEERLARLSLTLHRRGSVHGGIQKISVIWT